MSPSPVIPPHPLDQPGVVKIALSQASTDALTALGRHCLVIAAKADSTAPESLQGRMILYCLPITRELADDAYHVALGTHRAVKVKKSAALLTDK